MESSACAESRRYPSELRSEHNKSRDCAKNCKNADGGTAESPHRAVLLLTKSAARNQDDARVCPRSKLKDAAVKCETDVITSKSCRKDDEQRGGETHGTAGTAGRRWAEVDVQLRRCTLRGQTQGNSEAGEGGTWNGRRLCRSNRM